MSDDPFAPFRSRRARVVTLTLGAVAVLVFAAVGVGLYVASGRPDRLLLAAFGLAVAAVALSLATLSVLVVAPTAGQESEVLASAAPSTRVQAVVDVRYLSYEPATRLN